MVDWSQYPNFTPNEFRCHCGCGRVEMDAVFMGQLQKARTRYGSALVISSGFRCPDYNKAIGGGPEHVRGKAADITIAGTSARRFLTIAVDIFPRLGISQKGEHAKRFIHVGSAHPNEVGGASPALWSY